MIKFYFIVKYWLVNYYELVVVDFEDECDSIYMYLVLKIEFFWFVIFLFVLEICLICCIVSMFLFEM